MKRAIWTLSLVFITAPLTLPAQPVPSAPLDSAVKPEDKEKEKEKNDGIPITSELVRTSCGGCHKSDEKGRMSRISYRRTTPEGWEQTIKRMITLNGVRLEPEQAREIVKYLSNHLGLAPEEARPALFEAERRMIEYRYTADKDTESTCIRCHSFGRVLQQRRTKGDWELLIAMHRGYYPFSDFQAFRRMEPPQTEPGPDGRPPDNRHPMEKAVAHLSTAFPLKTVEWSAWSANMRTPKLDGRWAISGYQAGKGPIYGELSIEPAPNAPDEFRTHTRYAYAYTGETVTRDGKAIVYTGYQWRGRSLLGTGDQDPMREVLMVERSMREISGRWFNGAYGETGIDVKLQRLGNDPVVLGLGAHCLKTGSKWNVKIFGANLPVNLTPAAFDFGQGVKVARVIENKPDVVTVEVETATDAQVGFRDVYVSGAVAPAAAVVYDKVDSLKIRPEAGMARLGGIRFPKQMQQFEAIAYSNGLDGKPNTKDDIELGPVSVTWSMEEFASTFDDDDLHFVGTLDANGLFTPNVDGPNPKRHHGTNNYGDVWVVATYAPPQGSKDMKPIRARGHLLVTVPLYLRFDQPEVAP